MAMKNHFETESDALLIERSKRGEARAFDELIKRYQTRIVQLCFHMLHDHELANDVAQEALIHAYRGLKDFRMQSGFYTWLYRIAVNLCLNQIKKERSAKKAELKELSYSTKEGQEYIDKIRQWLPEEYTDSQGLQEAIERGLLTLSPGHKAVLMMFDIEGVSQKEIARILKIAEGTVRSRLHYARQHMRKYLKEYREG